MKSDPVLAEPTAPSPSEGSPGRRPDRDCDISRSGLTATARRGGGAYLDGARVELGATPETPRGVVLERFFSDDLRVAVAAGFADLELAAPARCAAHHYIELLTGTQHFALYYRTLVWDHAAGVLIAREAGAEVRRLDGASYRPDSDASTLLVASSAALWQRLRARLSSMA
jgi:fructose-1,6-bisphosphatase/inositol monophosphatase family enzyme